MEKISEDDLYTVLVDLGIDVQSSTGEVFLCYCPFHENSDSPAFAVRKTNGLWICFNQSCGEKGNLSQLIFRLAGGSKIKNLNRFMLQLHQESKAALDAYQEINSILGVEEEKQEDWDEIVDKIAINYDNPTEVKRVSYLLDRGFTVGTLRTFEIGYSAAKDRIVIPVRNENFKLVGVIGRAVDPDKKPKYLYSDNLPKKALLFNLSHAKTFKSVIAVEGSLDAMRVHQAGYPNVVAVLGAALSDAQAELVNRYFLDVIIFGDNDEAGRAMGETISQRCSSRNLFYVEYPEGIKDPGEMTDEQIRYAIEHKRSEIDIAFERFL